MYQQNARGTLKIEAILYLPFGWTCVCVVMPHPLRHRIGPSFHPRHNGFETIIWDKVKAVQKLCTKATAVIKLPSLCRFANVL